MKYATPADYDKVVVPVLDKALGYLYFMDREHPLADKKGRVWHHRHVASVALGRWLTQQEVAHHLDEVRSNNAPGNLEAKSPELHTKEHAAAALAESGLPPILEVICSFCGGAFLDYTRKGKYCTSACASLGRRKFEVDRYELSVLLEQYSMTAIAKKFGVSDKAVAKRAKLLGLR